MRKFYLISIIVGLGLTNCVNDQSSMAEKNQLDSLLNALNDAQHSIIEKNKRIQTLEKQITELKLEAQKLGDQEFDYPFEEYSDTNYKEQVSIRLIASLPLKDTLDIDPSHEYVYDHNLKLSLIKNHSLSELLENEREFQRTDHSTYGIKIIELCEEAALPLEYENCVSNYYIYLQPYELGYEGKLFKLSSLYAPTVKEITKEEEGFMIDIEHGKFPRKTQKIFISPEKQRIEN